MTTSSVSEFLKRSNQVLVTLLEQRNDRAAFICFENRGMFSKNVEEKENSSLSFWPLVTFDKVINSITSTLGNHGERLL